MTVSIAITSGKGGVGKTNCAVNVALSLSKTGKKVVLFDTDFGMANAHILLGRNPEHNAAEFLQGECDYLLKCMQWFFGFGMRNGGGYADTLNGSSRYRLQVTE